MPVFLQKVRINFSYFVIKIGSDLNYTSNIYVYFIFIVFLILSIIQDISFIYLIGRQSEIPEKSVIGEMTAIWDVFILSTRSSSDHTLSAEYLYIILVLDCRDAYPGLDCRDSYFVCYNYTLNTLYTQRFVILYT